MTNHYKKIVASIRQLQKSPVDVSIRMKARQCVLEELILDFDTIDDPAHARLSSF